jgi:hypothetical protein
MEREKELRMGGPSGVASIQNTFMFWYLMFHRFEKVQQTPPPTTTILESADRDEAGFAATLALQRWFQSRGFR